MCTHVYEMMEKRNVKWKKPTNQYFNSFKSWVLEQKCQSISSTAKVPQRPPNRYHIKKKSFFPACGNYNVRGFIPQLWNQKPADKFGFMALDLQRLVFYRP